jgi:hypothetical protein
MWCNKSQKIDRKSMYKSCWRSIWSRYLSLSRLMTRSLRSYSLTALWRRTLIGDRKLKSSQNKLLLCIRVELSQDFRVTTLAFLVTRFLNAKKFIIMCAGTAWK